MMTLPTFQDYLTFKDPRAQSPRRYNNLQEQQLIKWAALLPTQTEAQQVDQLLQVLDELTHAHVDDKWRLELAGIVMSAVDRVVITLRHRYCYESGALSDSQLKDLQHIKSLYMASIEVYSGIISRATLYAAGNLQHPTDAQNNWVPNLTRTKSSSSTLALAIYHALSTYLKILKEITLSYQKPPKNLWLTINQLYYLACDYDIAHTDLRALVLNRHAGNIHKLYCQICLHSLLNLSAMTRASILMVHRLLPLWSKHIIATLEPQTETRVYVDLHSDHPPSYLNAQSLINPYQEQYDCLFIELAPLVTYLQLRSQTLADEGNETAERCLLDKVWMAVTYRYIQPQRTLPTKQSLKQLATIITDFNAIHYYTSGSQSLNTLLDSEALPESYRPRYDTEPKPNQLTTLTNVETFDREDAFSHFRLLRLPIDSDERSLVVDQEPSLIKQAATSVKGKQAAKSIDIVANENQSDTMISTAPPRLRNMSLFLLCRLGITAKDNWSIGIVRWLGFDQKGTEVEWQILGNDISPCAVRLEDRSERSQSFVPAFLVAADEPLQTSSSLLLPRARFQPNDKVAIYINGEQQSLRLQDRLLITEEFVQYEIVRL